MSVLCCSFFHSNIAIIAIINDGSIIQPNSCDSDSDFEIPVMKRNTDYYEQVLVEKQEWIEHTHSGAELLTAVQQLIIIGHDLVWHCSHLPHDD